MLVQILINGEPRTLDSEPDVQSLLLDLGYRRDQHIAVAVNQEFVPRGDYASVRLHAGDEIDIVAPMQGG